MIHNSYWPTILRSDASASAGVCTQVNLLSWAILLGSVVLSLSSIVTPLGLYEAVIASKTPQVTRFSYVRDENSALGLGVSKRKDSA